jgi:hypothetical protein
MPNSTLDRLKSRGCARVVPRTSIIIGFDAKTIFVRPRSRVSSGNVVRRDRETPRSILLAIKLVFQATDSQGEKISFSYFTERGFVSQKFKEAADRRGQKVHQPRQALQSVKLESQEIRNRLAAAKRKRWNSKIYREKSTFELQDPQAPEPALAGRRIVESRTGLLLTPFNRTIACTDKSEG